MARRRTARTEAAEFAAQLPDEFLDCRVDNHDWVSRVRWDPNDICWHKVRHCRRCTTEVVRFYSQTGARLPGGGYTYAEGYQNKGKGRLTGSDLDALRLESFTRHAEDPMPLITRK